MVVQELGRLREEVQVFAVGLYREAAAAGRSEQQEHVMWTMCAAEAGYGTREKGLVG